VPCSATGTIRRHPDLPWIKSEESAKSLVDLQFRLLKSAVSLLAEGGVLVYVNCSLQKEEGVLQVSRFLEQNLGIERLPIVEDEIYSMGELLTEDGDLRTLPCYLSDIGGMDGFYAARLKRVS